MRGQQSLYNSLFQTDDNTNKKSQLSRPRNYFLPERNEALCHRYYFHAEINRLRYDDCLTMLETEFYLTTPRLIVLLNENSHILTRIMQQKPSLKQLKAKFPYFNWKSSRL